MISQTALDHFRTSLATKQNDPYSVLLRRNKLPMALLDDAANPNTRKVCKLIFPPERVNSQSAYQAFAHPRDRDLQGYVRSQVPAQEAALGCGDVRRAEQGKRSGCGGARERGTRGRWARRIDVRCRRLPDARRYHRAYLCEGDLAPYLWRALQGHRLFGRHHSCYRRS